MRRRSASRYRNIYTTVEAQLEKAAVSASCNKFVEAEYHLNKAAEILALAVSSTERFMKHHKLLLVAGVMLAGNSLQAQYPPPFYWPINPPPTSDCPGTYQSSRNWTNQENGSLWFVAPSSGVAVFTDVSDYTNHTRVSVIRRNDFNDWCGTNQVCVYVQAGLEYRVHVYYKTALPSEPLQVQIDWPQTRLDIAGLKAETETPSEVVFTIFAPETNKTYQLFYSQRLTPNITNWIPHDYFSGRFSPFLKTNVAHMTTNRPDGFWALWSGGTVYFPPATNMNSEDVDEPVGYPPPTCTNNCSTNITPPEITSP